MYIGRFVVLGRTAAGLRFLGYRVSSRSFPNRRIILGEDRAAVLPTQDAAPTDNPYIAYNCLRTHGDVAVVANGSHVDPVIDKVSAGYPLRDALALALLAMDYEHDDYDTPRIAAGWEGETGYLAIVAAEKLLVRGAPVAPGEAQLMATYALTEPTPLICQGEDAEALAQAVYAAPYEHPVAALAALLGESLSLAQRSPA
jgi:IMP cyclohydrolase